MTTNQLIEKLKELDPNGEMELVVTNDPWPSAFPSLEQIKVITLQHCENNNDYWHVYRGTPGKATKDFIVLWGL